MAGEGAGHSCLAWISSHLPRVLFREPLRLMCLKLTAIGLLAAGVTAVVLASINGSSGAPGPEVPGAPPDGGTGRRGDTVKQTGIMNLHAKSTVSLVLGTMSTIAIVIIGICMGGLGRRMLDEYVDAGVISPCEREQSRMPPGSFRRMDGIAAEAHFS